MEVIKVNKISIDRVLELIRHEGGDRAQARQWMYRIQGAQTRAGADKILRQFNDAWNFSGVEFSRRIGDDSYTSPEGLLYCNAGDTYAVTLCYDTKESRFFVGCWGDWHEQMQREALDEAWNDWIASDFEGAVGALLDLWLLDIDKDDLRLLFNECCTASGKYPEVDGDSFLVEVEAIAKMASIEALERHGAAVERMGEDEENSQDDRLIDTWDAEDWQKE